jgi:TctA family transporter
VLAALAVGILTGLLPALPVYIGPFILYYFGSNMPVEHLITFWLVVVSGSQFFGSVATITTKIPGEESSLIYLQDLDQLTHSEKNSLLHDTALGSMIAGILGTMFVYVCLQFVNLENMPYLASVKFQIVIYTITVLSFLFLNKNVVWTVFLIALGLTISPQHNYAINDTWFLVQKIFHGYTFFLVLLGTLIIPEIVGQFHKPTAKVSGYAPVADKTFDIWSTIKSSLLGMFSGLIPGPSASIAANMAYHAAGPDVKKRITAAETANNASVITCAIPLLAFALPINQNTILMSNLSDIRSFFIPDVIWNSSFVTGMSVLDLVCVTVSVCLIVYYFLSTRLIDFYANLVLQLHHRMKFVLVAIVSVLVAVDLFSAEIDALHYLLLLAGFAALGIWLKFKEINPIPLLFSIVLGDKLIWLYLQIYNIYF